MTHVRSAARKATLASLSPFRRRADFSNSPSCLRPQAQLPQYTRRRSQNRITEGTIKATYLSNTGADPTCRPGISISRARRRCQYSTNQRGAHNRPHWRGISKPEAVSPPGPSFSPRSPVSPAPCPIVSVSREASCHQERFVPTDASRIRRDRTSLRFTQSCYRSSSKSIP